VREVEALAVLLPHDVALEVAARNDHKPRREGMLRRPAVDFG
jgi:hypothetical protein